MRHLFASSLLFATLCLLIACGGFSSRSSKPTGTVMPGVVRDQTPGVVGDQQPVAELTNVHLLEAYTTALSADRLYTGKAILLSGMVVSSSQSEGRSLVVVGDFENRNVYCYFRSDSEAAKLHARQGVILLGLCRGVDSGGRVNLDDCSLVPDVTKYRTVSPLLVSRFNSLQPAKVFEPVTFSSGDEQDRRIKELAAYAGRIIEVRVPESVGRAPGLPLDVNDADPIIPANMAICHFDPKLAPELKKMRFGWPLRIRGQVAPRKEPGGVDLLDCGLSYWKR